MGKSNKDNRFGRLTAEEVLEYFPLPFYILLEDGKIIHCNRAALKFYGYKKMEEIVGLTPYSLSPASQPDGTSSDAKGKEMISEAQKAGYHRFRWLHQKKNGRTFLAEVELFAKNGFVFATVKDIDLIEKHKKNRAKILKEMKNLASRDYLTGLYNKSFFEKRLDRMIKLSCRSKEKVAVLFIDFNNLKEINDTFGHALGDKTIIEAAMRLRETAPNGCLLARFGGDEFVLAVSFVASKSEVYKIAQRLQESLDIICRVGNHEFYLSASIGIACCPEDGKDAETLLKNADIAMYQAKQEKTNEKNIVFYSQVIGQKTQERFLLENLLKKAMGMKELSVYLQPIVSIAENRIISAEALLRWESKVYGQVPPSKFISLAEESGIIHELGKYVLHEACRFLQSERTKGAKFLPIAVNISLKQLENWHFATEVKQILSSYELEGKHFEFEITERVSAGNMEAVVENLKGIKKLGIKISMDDFGTGYSSLGMLLNLEIDKIKIDRTFIKNIGKTREEKIIKTVVSMAKKLGLTVVAEGVEKEDEVNFLKKINCECGQGYYWAKPMPIAEFEKYLH
ncbi:MAG: EAL domain-containing protein [Peptococcaceae bacterium]|nr:EAL domain-containing protein [Peptococcaceae bacterium]